MHTVDALGFTGSPYMYWVAHKHQPVDPTQGKKKVQTTHQKGCIVTFNCATFPHHGPMVNDLRKVLMAKV